MYNQSQQEAGLEALLKREGATLYSLPLSVKFNALFLKFQIYLVLEPYSIEYKYINP